MVKRGESLSEEHKRRIGEGLRRNAAARVESSRRAMEVPNCICRSYMVYPDHPEWPANYSGMAFRKTVRNKACRAHPTEREAVGEIARCGKCRRPRDNSKVHPTLCPICLLEETNAHTTA